MRALQLLLLGTAVLASACGNFNRFGNEGSSTGTSSSSSSSSSSGGGSSSSGSSSSGGSSSSSGSSGGATVISGYYNGSYTRSSAAAGNASFYLDAKGNGELVEFSAGQATSVIPIGPVLPGAHSYSATAYGVNGHLLDNGGASESFSAQLTGTQGAALGGTYSDGGGISGGITTGYTAFTPYATLASIAGTYAFGYSTGGQNYTGTVTIDSNGNVTGSDSFGCNYSGTISGPPADNVFDLAFNVSCLSGSLSGILYAPGNTSSLSLAVSNSTGALYEQLTKQ